MYFNYNRLQDAGSWVNFRVLRPIFCGLRPIIIWDTFHLRPAILRFACYVDRALNAPANAKGKLLSAGRRCVSGLPRWTKTETEGAHDCTPTFAACSSQRKTNSAVDRLGGETFRLSAITRGCVLCTVYTLLTLHGTGTGARSRCGSNCKSFHRFVPRERRER